MRSVLRSLIKPKVTGVQIGEVLTIAVGRVRLKTLLGEIWARCDMAVMVGDFVAYSRDGAQLVVLQKTGKPKVATKVVRI